MRLRSPVTDKNPLDPEKKLQLRSPHLQPQGQHKALDRLAVSQVLLETP